MDLNQEQIYLKIQELLSLFQRTKTNSQIHLMSFLNKKASLSDKKKLRNSLIKQIKSHRNCPEINYNWEQLLKLKAKPVFPLASISISYSYHLGGFIIVFDKKADIGFDIELKNRITDPVVQRISSQSEFNQSPHPALLWVAKEAGVKSLSTFKLSVLFKDCIVLNWNRNPCSQNYSFDFYIKNSHKYKGVAGFVNGLAIAYTESFSNL